jgi:dTDP-4-dehydrorhamnose 3,5-epimerase-like enzyme
MENHWNGLRPEAAARLVQREYGKQSLAEQLATSGVSAGELFGMMESASVAAAWIPGVALLPLQVYPQLHRGRFAELARAGAGTLGHMELWPRQWSVAHMFRGTAKGFHIHPPHIPAGHAPEEWFQTLFPLAGEASLHPPYSKEQWDVMFVTTGNVEMFLVDERAGLPRRLMRFMVHGHDQPGRSNVGVIIPPGVAHALRVEGDRDVVMIYGTTTTFDPANEGRIAAEVEQMPLPPGWEAYIKGS